MPHNACTHTHAHAHTHTRTHTHTHTHTHMHTHTHAHTHTRAQGQPIKDIESYGCSPWPDMQDLITQCLQYSPNNRPSAQAIFDRMCSAEFVCLKRAISVEYGYPVETFAIRVWWKLPCDLLHNVISLSHVFGIADHMTCSS